jgi:hypothetical protein
MANLFEIYPEEQGNKKAANLFEVYKDDSYHPDMDPMETARAEIKKQYPGMPDWLREGILKTVGTEPHPVLEAASKGISNVTDYIPAAVGGALQGASIPIRGAASLFPGKFAQNLANSPDLRGLFPEAQGTGQKSVQMAAELAGGGGLFGKLMQGVKGAAQLARVPQSLQNSAALAGAGAIATPGDIGDKSVGAGGALALGGLGNVAQKVGSKVSETIPAFLRGLSSKSTKKDLVSAIQKPHDLLESSANELYGQVNQAIKNRNINIPMKPEFLAQAREYFPRKTSVDELFDKAKAGDYKAIHKIQSSLYKKGTKQLAGDDLVSENEGEEIIDLRDRMNDFLEDHLIKEGHLDVAHVLKQGKNSFAELMNTYFPKHLRKGIGKMVHPELRLIPKNPENLFAEDSVPMRNFLEKHPEAAKHALGVQEKKEANKMLKKLLLGSVYSTAGAGGAASLYNLFK